MNNFFYAGKKSLSLLEVLIAIALLTLVLSSTVALFGQGFMIGRKSKDKITAYNLIREKLDQYSVYPFLSNSTENYGTITDFPDFRRVTAIVDYTYAGRLKNITVKVYWNNNSNNISMSTLQTNYRIE